MAPKKKPNLAAALASQPAAQAGPQALAPRANDAGGARRATSRPGREGQTQIAAWFPLAVSLQLDELRLHVSRQRGRKVTLAQLQAEAYNDIFKKYGLAEIAPGSSE